MNWQRPHIIRCDLSRDGLVVEFDSGEVGLYAHETMYAMLDLSQKLGDISDPAEPDDGEGHGSSGS